MMSHEPTSQAAGVEVHQEWAGGSVSVAAASSFVPWTLPSHWIFCAVQVKIGALDCVLFALAASVRIGRGRRWGHLHRLHHHHHCFHHPQSRIHRTRCHYPPPPPPPHHRRFRRPFPLLHHHLHHHLHRRSRHPQNHLPR